MKQRKRAWDFGLLPLFAVIVFLSTLINTAITAMAVYLLVHIGILSISSDAASDIGSLLFLAALVSIPVSILVALVVSHVPLKPVRNLIDSMDRLASGDFGTRVNVGAIMRKYPAFVEVSQSFNKMARELENTEMLRSDFINNFSHEFKTPIVSIAGFAKLLRRGNLTR